jgi:O-antigen/teichoic acid export membrane protein
LLIVLADPIVAVLLGPQWHNAVPIVGILATSLLFSFPLVLHYPVLVAVGAIRFIPPVLAGQAIFSITLLSFAATKGLQTAALSMLLIVPINSLISLCLVRRFIRFSWISFGSAVKKSAACALASAVGPIAVGIRDGWPNHVSIGMGVAALALSGVGWLFGLWLTRHPLLGEIRRAAVALRGHPIATKLLRRPTTISCGDTDGA